MIALSTWGSGSVAENMALVNVAHLYVTYETNPSIRAVTDVSFEVEETTCLCIVGESGCGKSSLARAVGRILPPSGRIKKGDVYIDGEEITRMSENKLNREIRWKKYAIIFQNAATSLNPFLRVQDQITEVLTRHLGISKEQALQRSQDVLTSVKFPVSRMRSYPHELSGGMKQRVAIAIALACNPKLVIGDEIATGLDVTTAAQIGVLLKELVHSGLTLILNTHDIGFATDIADNLAVMYAGRIVEVSPTDDWVRNPSHPYSIALLASIPRSNDPNFKPKSIPGDPPKLSVDIPGCPFAPRCRHVQAICYEKEPPLVSVGTGKAACHFAGRLEELE